MAAYNEILVPDNEERELAAIRCKHAQENKDQ